jgi:hypothetical protein
VHRHPDRSSRVGQPALQRLADPQRPVGRELEPAPPVELLDRANQPEHPLLDQVPEREPLTLVAARLRDDQPQVGVDHSLLGLEVPALDALRELDLLFGGEQGIPRGLAEEELQRIGRGLGSCRLPLAPDVVGGVMRLPAPPLAGGLAVLGRTVVPWASPRLVARVIVPVPGGATDLVACHVSLSFECS